MPQNFEDLAVIDETPRRMVGAWALLSKESIETVRRAAATTYRELWAGNPSPEALAEAMDGVGQQAVDKHRAAGLFLAMVAAAEAGSTVIGAAVLAAVNVLLEGAGTEDAIPGANAAATVIAGLQPQRAILPGPDGTITIAPADPE